MTTFAEWRQTKDIQFVHDLLVEMEIPPDEFDLEYLANEGWGQALSNLGQGIVRGVGGLAHGIGGLGHGVGELGHGAGKVGQGTGDLAQGVGAGGADLARGVGAGGGEAAGGIGKFLGGAGRALGRMFWNPKRGDIADQSREDKWARKREVQALKHQMKMAKMRKKAAKKGVAPALAV